MPHYHALFERAIEAALNGATVVTGNERAAARLRSACEARLAESRTAWPTPDILPWQSFVTQLWRDVAIASGDSRILLSPDQELRLWEVISRSDVAAHASIAPLALEAWRLIHAYELPFPSAHFETRQDTRTFARLASHYRDECERNGWLDTAILTKALINKITRTSNSRVRSLSALTVYGIDDLTPQQETFLRHLENIGVSVQHLTVAQPADFADAQSISLADPEAELRSAAAWARAILERSPAARIGVLVPDLGERRTEAERIFAEVLHPEQALLDCQQNSRAFDVSLGPALAEYGLVHTAIAILRLSAGELNVSEAGALIRSPYLPGAQTEASARALLDVQLRKLKSSAIDPQALITQARNAGCGQLVTCLFDWSRTIQDFGAPRTPAQWTQAFTNAVAAFGWPGKQLDSTEFQTHEAWNKLLARFAATDLVDHSAISAADAVAMVKNMAANQPFRPKNAAAPIQVLGLLEASGSVFDHVWVCGLSDEAWPPRGRRNPLIPPELDPQHRLPHSTPQQQVIFAEETIARVLASASHVVFSWAKRDEDRELRPAAVLRRVRSASLAELQAVPTPAWIESFRASGLETFTDESAPPLPPGVVHRGGTRIFEWQSNCPFRAFIQSRLATYPLQNAYDGPDARDRGKCVERVLELVWQRLIDKQRLDDRWNSSELRTIVEQAVDTALDEQLQAHDTWSQRFRRLERARLLALAFEWLAIEHEREYFRVVQHQQSVEIDIGGLKTNGLIDRVDQLNDGRLVIIDYKAGTPQSASQWRAPRPESPQLPVYSVIQKHDAVAAVAFANVRAGACGISGYALRREILAKSTAACEREMNAEIATWRDELERIAHDFLAGDAAVDPKDPPATCANCHLPAVCRIRELTPEVRDDA